MKILISNCALVLAVTLGLPQNYVPNSGFVPDAKTAIKIAEAVLVPVYGETKIREEEPFTANLKGDTWTVEGTLDCKDQNGKQLPSGSCTGGVAMVKLSKRDGRILSMGHGK